MTRRFRVLVRLVAGLLLTSVSYAEASCDYVDAAGANCLTASQVVQSHSNYSNYVMKVQFTGGEGCPEVISFEGQTSQQHNPGGLISRKNPVREINCTSTLGCSGFTDLTCKPFGSKSKPRTVRNPAASDSYLSGGAGRPARSAPSADTAAINKMNSEMGACKRDYEAAVRANGGVSTSEYDEAFSDCQLSGTFSGRLDHNADLNRQLAQPSALSAVVNSGIVAAPRRRFNSNAGTTSSGAVTPKPAGTGQKPCRKTNALDTLCF